MTPTAIAHLDALAYRYRIEGQSAFIEQLGRGMLQVSQPTASIAPRDSLLEERKPL